MMAKTRQDLYAEFGMNVPEQKQTSEDYVRAFIRRFDAWIVQQSAQVQFSTMLAFGEEYRKMREWFEVEKE